MPIVRNKVPGDVTYPDYSRIFTFKAAGAVAKGDICSLDASGMAASSYNIGLAAGKSSAKVTAYTAAIRAFHFGFSFNTGLLLQAGVVPIMQAMNKADAAGDELSCLMPGSRILVPATAGLRPGQNVGIITSQGDGGAGEYGADDVGKAATLNLGDFESGTAVTARRAVAIRTMCTAGRVFEIYGTKEDGLPFTTDLAEKKYVSADGDLVILELAT